MKNLVLILFSTAFIVACQSPYREQSNLHDKNIDSLTASIHGQEHKHYLAEHYWDNIPLSDSLSAVGLPAFKESLADYLLLLHTFQPELAKETMTRFLNRKITSVPLLIQVGDLLENYLYDPLSPLRNDELYAIFLEYKLTFPNIEDIYLVRTRYQLNIISKNRINQTAEDFTYMTAQSKKTFLSAIKSNYTLLYFYNPDCPYCKDTTAKMKQSNTLKQLKTVRQGLSILAICTEPTKNTWSDYILSLPADWINGYNDKLHTLQLYDLRALPSLYLLDENKKVICKDATFEQIETVLAELQQQGKL